MKRRSFCQAVGGAVLTPLVFNSSASPLLAPPKSQATAGKTRIKLGDDYFLSRVNPTATVDQLYLEKQALEALETPVIRQAKAKAMERYRILDGHNTPAEALENLEQKMEEWAFHYTLMAMNSDSSYPRIQHHDYGPPHEWFGMSVPGSRGPGTGENVDNAYAKFPVDGFSRFELHGQRMNPATGDCPFHVVSNLSMSMNISELGLRDLQISRDGSFVVTIGPEPANGRPNHLQTTRDAKYVFIRDARMDWDQIPNAYRLYRLDPPLAPEMSIEEKSELAARFIVDDVATNFWFKQMVNYVPENTVSLPDGSDFWGGQPSQMLGRGHIKLGDDEAFVMTLNADGSSYHNVILYDYWLMSGNFWSKTSSLNNKQTRRNADGSYTYVFSSQDPGIYNWIDTLGLHENLFFLRFQLLPRNAQGQYTAKPAVTGKRVKLKDLDNLLPDEVKRVTAGERAEQIAQRLASFNKRFEV